MAVEAMTLLGWAFDGLLGLGLLWLAGRALSSPDLFRAIVLFVAFGLLMALAWVRLDAPDIALAEVAIGAGLTGALLLAILARLPVEERTQSGGEQTGSLTAKGRFSHGLPAVLSLSVAVGLGYAILSLPPQATGLGTQVAANLETSGVSNPVTAVLLNFRGYDTLLEVMVLLLALLGAWSLGGTAVRHEVEAGPVLDTLSRVLVPVLILVSAYLLWVGSHAPGGAFQAGAVLGAAGVLLLLVGWRLHVGLMGLPLRLMLMAGPSAFIVLAVLMLVIDGYFLGYPPEHAGTLILLLESTAMFSIGATLAALFLGVRPQDEVDQ